jgi:hypothetical protein
LVGWLELGWLDTGGAGGAAGAGGVDAGGGDAGAAIAGASAAALATRGLRTRFSGLSTEVSPDESPESWVLSDKREFLAKRRALAVRERMREWFQKGCGVGTRAG